LAARTGTADPTATTAIVTTAATCSRRRVTCGSVTETASRRLIRFRNQQDLRRNH
jgi:hypothetical protein